jgi:hypothetical protein
VRRDETISLHRVVLDLCRVNQYLRSRAHRLLSKIRGRNILAALGQEYLDCPGAEEIA